MRVLLVDAVVASIVEAKHNISLDTLSVVDEQVGDGSTVWDEVGTDTLRDDGVFAVSVGYRSAVAIDRLVALGKGSGRQKRRQTERKTTHDGRVYNAVTRKNRGRVAKEDEQDE